ncbi:MAG: hypothetical protein A2583_14730 [Bdellovibrionales bacterium RIFOXYD1_FULL_53_11]|nr:MAG: hypothetical protein A2583_14730 [Bdellovibrionales bacterium RIFOXYD1_FULL_53_11]
MNTLELDGERALFENKIQALAVVCQENERPLGGLLGLVDWRFGGVISQSVRTGFITGRTGECCYIPLVKTGKTFHLIVIGAGHAEKHGHRLAPPVESVKALQKNLLSLKLKQTGISRSDFGGQQDEYFSRHFKGVPLWIVT